MGVCSDVYGITPILPLGASSAPQIHQRPRERPGLFEWRETNILVTTKMGMKQPYEGMNNIYVTRWV